MSHSIIKTAAPSAKAFRRRKARPVRWLLTPAIIMGLCVLSAAFFWKLIVLHQVLIPIDLLTSNDSTYSFLSDPLWQSPHAHTIIIPANQFDSDNVMEMYPWLDLATQALRHGVLPLWNPYAFAGTPFLAAMQPAVFYPINVMIEHLLSSVDAIGARAMVHLALTLVGTFLFARRLALSRPAALLTALSFGLGLPFVVWLVHPYTLSFTWLPWILLSVECAVATGGNLRWLVTIALLVALEIVAGHGETGAHVLFLCTAYAIFRIILSWFRDGRSIAIRSLLILIAALALGVMISAAHTLPSLAQLARSHEVAYRSHYADVPVWGEARQWTTLILAVIPNFFGNPTWHVSILPVLNYDETALYVGAIPLLLAVLALLRRRDAYTVFFAVTALVALGVALRFPVLSLVNNLPVIRLLSNGRLRIGYAFGVAVLAGYGFDVLLQDASSRLVWRLTRLCTLLLCILVIPSVILLHAYPSIFALLQAHPAVFIILNRIYPGVQEFLRTHSLHNTLTLPEAARAAAPAIWLALFTVLLWLYRHRVVTARVLPVATLAIVVVDLFTLGSGYHTTVPRAQATTIPPAVQAVQRDRSLYRVVGLGTALLPSTSSLFDLQDIRGYDPMYDASYERFFVANFAAKPSQLLEIAAAEPSRVAARTLDLMNVKYIFTSCNVHLDLRMYHPVYRGTGCVYRNVAVLPRVLLIHNIQWATPKRATELLGRGVVDPRTTALLDPTTANKSAWAVAPLSKGASVDSAQVTNYSFNQVDITTQSSTGGLLVLSDAYAPGWTAYVDGQSATIALANAIFRAVRVGSGTHHVSFRYEPASFLYGVIISVIGLMIACGLLVATVLIYLKSRKRMAARPLVSDDASIPLGQWDWANGVASAADD